MRKAITLAATLLVLGASAAMAQNALYLNWDDCSGGTPNHDKTFACNTNTGAAFTLIASVQTGSTMAHFAAATTVIDIHVNDTALPAWWLTYAGQCRANSISMSYDPANNTSSCADVWGGGLNVGVFAVQDSLHGDNSVRVNGVGAIPAGSEIAVPTNTELWLCRVTINRASTLACAGCTTPACIVLNQSELLSPDEPKIVITEGAATTGWAMWQGAGTLNCPGGTPTKNRTWGAVKNLYR